jgi:hypothetical protein
MTEQEFNNAVNTGQVAPAELPQPPQPQNDQPDISDIQGYVPVLEVLRRPKPILAAVPTFTPKTFADSIQWVDDGTTKRPVFYITDQWVDLAALIPALAPDAFSSFQDFIHWGTTIANSGFGEITSGSGLVIANDGNLVMAAAALVNHYHGVASKDLYYSIAETGKPVTAEWIIVNMDNGSGVPNFPMTDCEIRGYLTTDGNTTFPSDTHDHFGFKLIGGLSLTIFGSVADGTTESTVSLDVGTYVTGKQLLRLKAVLTRGTDCKFYINGVLKGTIATHLPTVPDLGINMTIKTVTGTQKTMNWGRVLIEKTY